MSQTEFEDPETIRRNVGRIAASYETSQGRAIGCIRNVSKHGIFVTASTLPAPEEPVVVTFTDLRGRAVRIAGSVRWTTDQLDRSKRGGKVFGGFGVRLQDADESFTGFFQQILES